MTIIVPRELWEIASSNPLDMLLHAQCLAFYKRNRWRNQRDLLYWCPKLVQL